MYIIIIYVTIIINDWHIRIKIINMNCSKSKYVYYKIKIYIWYYENLNCSMYVCDRWNVIMTVYVIWYNISQKYIFNIV